MPFLQRINIALTAEFGRLRKKRSVCVSSHGGAEAGLQCWSAPASDFVKLNCDADTDTDSGDGVIAVIAWDSDGVVLDGLARPEWASSVDVLETKAILPVAEFASEKGWNKILVEIDSIRVFEQLKKPGMHLDWRTAPVVESATRSASLCTDCVWSHVRRDGNQPANWVATHCKMKMCPMN